jgi:hypothetical protein
MQMKTEAGKAHEIKNPAIAFGIYGQGAKRLGDVAVTSKGLVWSNGRKASKDITVKWDAFIDWMQSQLQAGGKAAAAKTGRMTKAAKTTTKAASTRSGKTARTGAALRRAGKSAASKGRINGRPAASKVSAIAASKQKPANKTAH